MKAKCAWFLCVFFLFSFPFEDKVAMDNLERKRTAEEDVDETVERKLLKGLLRGNGDAGPHGPYV